MLSDSHGFRESDFLLSGRGLSKMVVCRSATGFSKWLIFFNYLHS